MQIERKIHYRLFRILCLGCDIESVRLGADLDARQKGLIFEHGMRSDKMKDSSTSFTIDR
jgi:hypothetical protein